MYNKDFYYKDSSLIGLIAPRGTGKTLLLSAIAQEELASAVNAGYSGFRIFHNGFLNSESEIWKVPGESETRLIEYGLEDIINTVESGETDMENGLVLLDEVASVQDNRLGGLAYGSVLFSHWIIMIRKIGLTIIWAGQNEELDRRIKLQTDIVGYCTVSRRRKGKEVGVSWVYQNSVYSYEGHKRNMMYYGLDKFWEAYDTRKIIKTESLSKTDIKLLQTEQVEEKIYDDIYAFLKNKEDKKLSLMQIKKLCNISWQLNDVEKFAKYIGKQTKTKGTFNFEGMF